MIELNDFVPVEQHNCTELSQLEHDLSKKKTKNEHFRKIDTLLQRKIRTWSRNWRRRSTRGRHIDIGYKLLVSEY